jgi:hypothetical protein
MIDREKKLVDMTLDDILNTWTLEMIERLYYNIDVVLQERDEGNA